jgi:hypothetical protein
MKRILLVLTLLALPLAAQEQKKEEAPRPGRVQKLFVLKYADPAAVRNLLDMFGGSITANSEMHTLAVTAPPETMKAIEDAVARLDTPAAAPKDIDLTFYLLVGSDAATAPSGPLPKDLESVVTQLRNAFAFKNYHLMDVLTLRTRAGQRAETRSSGGAVEVGTGTQAVITSIRLASASIAPDGMTIRIDGMQSGIRMPVPAGPGTNPGFQYVDLGMNSDLDIKDGQKVVVGRMGISRDQALFLVVTAHPVS